jgi:hypothetical protein
MRNWLKSYFAFCGLAFNEEYKPVRGYKPMRWLWLLIAFILGVVVSDFFGIALLDLIKPIIKLLPYQWWIVIVLAGIILFLLSLVDGARRYHARKIKELGEAHAADISERKQHEDIMHRLSIVYGMVLQADDTIRDFKTPLPKDALTYLNSHIDNALYNSFGAQGRDGYYENMRGIPDSPEYQGGWIYSHRSRLGGYVEHERGQLSKPPMKPKPELPP